MAAPMHNMTRLPSAGVPSAPFDGGVFRFKDDEVRFSRRGDDRLMTIVSATQPARTFRVTRVIGGHYREDFAGVEEGGKDAHTERILPATWFIGTHAWRYKGYSVMGPERPGLRPGGVWSKTCIFCHNTIPYFDDLLGALSDPKIGPYQGEVVDPLLAARAARALRRHRRSGLASRRRRRARACSARAQAARKRATSSAPRARASTATSSSRSASAASRATAAASSTCATTRPSRRTSRARAFLRVSAARRARAAAPRAVAINRVCARCHQVLFTRYAWTWEGARARGDAARRQQHQQRRGARLSARRLRVGDGVLATATIRTRTIARTRPSSRRAPTASACAATRSTRRPRRSARTRTTIPPAPAGAASPATCRRRTCRSTTALGRYHRIASPTETAKVEGDRPLECALCHGDKSVETLVATMEAWWHKSLRPRAAARALRRRSGARRSAGRDAGARQAARAGGGAGARRRARRQVGGAAGGRAADASDPDPALLRRRRARAAPRRTSRSTSTPTTT